MFPRKAAGRKGREAESRGGGKGRRFSGEAE